MIKKDRLLAAFLLGLCFGTPLSHAAVQTAITTLSLEDLMNVEVTSVARKPQSVSRTPAAVFVITQEDIRRSGAFNIPDALRMVPGLQVAQIDASRWAISARGFNGTLSNKLLVLIDGRSVYTPLHAGVYWDIQGTPVLKDIERIEVIRGLGASVWGSNAVNGVINIITKHSADTQGGYIKGGLGSEVQDSVVRYGGKASENLTYRGYGKYLNNDHSHLGNDAWYLTRGGARTDWQADENDSVQLQGDYYNGEEDLRQTVQQPFAPFVQRLNEDQSVAGGNILSRWDHKYSEDSDASLQTYFDYQKRDSPILEEHRYTYDLDWHHRFLTSERNEFMYGVGYRLMADQTKGSFSASFQPANEFDHLYQFFVQDELELLRNQLWLTAGSRFEFNDYTGFEFQPTARLLWQPHHRHTLWTAFSRAVRIPSRLDHHLVINGFAVPGTALLRAEGDSSRSSERLFAYEGGYRVQPHDRVTLDIAGFFNDYSGLTTTRAGSIFNENTYTVSQHFIDDQSDGESYGAEIAAQLELHQNWRVQTAYTYLEVQVHAQNNSLGSSEAAEGQSPEHQASIRSMMDLPYNFELDVQLRGVGKLPALGTPRYFELDIRVGYRPFENLELSLLGKNLLQPYHLEFPGSAGEVTKVQLERALYGKAEISF